MYEQRLAFLSGFGELYRRAKSAIAICSLVQNFRHPKSICFAFTFFVNFCSIGSALLTFKLAALAFGTVGFGSYAVTRRVSAIICFPLLLSLGISIPRYVALPRDERNHENCGDLYYVAAWLIAVPVLFMVLVMALVFPGWLTLLFFGENKYIHLLLPTVAVVSGLYVHQLVYGYCVGRLQLWRANLMCLINLSVIPPMAVALSGGKIERSLASLGLMTLGVSSVVGLLGARELSTGPQTFPSCLKPMCQLLSFGLPRIPGEFALFGLSAIPTILIAHRHGIERAGLISFCYSLVQMIGGMFGATSTLLLPIVSRMRAQEQVERIGTLMASVLAYAMSVGVFVVVVAEASLGFTLPLLLNQKFAGALPEARWALLSAIPFILYVVLRGPLDAVDVWPHNTVNLCLALGIVVLLLVAVPGKVSPSVALLVGMSALGLASVASWVWSLRRHRRRIAKVAADEGAFNRVHQPRQPRVSLLESADTSG